MERLTQKREWEEIWARVSLPVVARASHDLRRLFPRYLPPSSDNTLIEIGCAPGAWMVLFHQMFGYAVNGLDYADAAVDTTRKNLEMQGVPANVVKADFFDYDPPDCGFDVVFSGGFIEHFSDLQLVVGKITGLSRGYVVTLVPSVCGINGWICRVMRPAVYDAHMKIDVAQLQALHEANGLETLFCNWVGGLKFISIAPRRSLSSRRSPFWLLMEIPFRAFNVASELFGRLTLIHPRTRLLSTSLLYIGRKRET